MNNSVKAPRFLLISLILFSMFLVPACRTKVSLHISRDPAMACDGGGRTAVVWREPIGGGEFRFYGTVLPDKDYTTILTARSVTANTPKLDATDLNQYFFTYSESTDMTRHLYGLVLNGDHLAVFSGSTQITDAANPTDEGVPQYDIAFDPDLNRVLVVWNKPGFGHTSQLAYRFVHIVDHETFPTDGPVQLVPSDAGKKINPRTVLGQYNGEGGSQDAFFVPYINKVYGSGSSRYTTVYGIFISYPDVILNTVTIASLSGEPDPTYDYVAAAYDAGMNRYLVACRRTGQIEGYFVSESGTVSGPIIITDVVTYGTISTTRPLMLAFSETLEQYMLAYYAMPPGTGGGWKNALFTILLDRDGVPVDSRVQRGASLNIQGGGELDTDPSSVFKIVYEEGAIVSVGTSKELDEDSLKVYYDSYSE